MHMVKCIDGRVDGAVRAGLASAISIGTQSLVKQADISPTMQSMRWLPLEANPDVMNQFLKQLGVGISWQFVDVYGMDPELLSMVPRPVCAVLLLFPVTEKYELFRAEEEEKIKSHGQEMNSSVYFMKQTISNACGTIGLIHAVANNREKLDFECDSALKKFLEESLSLSPEERAKFLEKDESIRVTHESSAQEGQSEAPSIDDKVDLHFVAFVHLQGHLYELDLCDLQGYVKEYCSFHLSPLSENSRIAKIFPFKLWEFDSHCCQVRVLATYHGIVFAYNHQFCNKAKTAQQIFYCLTDGRKPFPVNHGQTSDDTLLEDAIEVCKKFMQRDPDELRFTVVAFSKA